MLYKTKVNIVIFILCKNEEENIETLIKSLSLLGKIVLFDTGSTDNTLVLARSNNIEVVSIVFTGDYSKVRTNALHKIKCKWILSLDADERVRQEEFKKIRELIKDETVDGYWFPRRNFINDKIWLKHGYFYPDWQLRLFRNDKGYRYSGRIHEHIQIPKNKTRYISDIEIIHNSSHTKFGSFFTISRFFNYVKIEGNMVAKGKESIYNLWKFAFFEFPRHFYRSFFKLSGYKDGYYGWRAAVLFGIYKSMIYFYAIYIRIIKK